MEFREPSFYYGMLTAHCSLGKILNKYLVIFSAIGLMLTAPEGIYLIEISTIHHSRPSDDRRAKKNPFFQSESETMSSLVFTPPAPSFK